MFFSFVARSARAVRLARRGSCYTTKMVPRLRAVIFVGLASTHCSTQPSGKSTGDVPTKDAGANGAGSTLDAALCSADQGLRLYDERIDPLFRDDRPSTCNQCHLSGINLKQYVQASPCETYACLVQQQLVNERQPEDSKVLGWIKRATPESDLITQEVIDAEYDAFLEWISFNSRCEECASVTCPLPTDAGTFCPDENEDPHAVTNDAGIVDPGGCAQADLERVFRATVYEQRGRCSPCHFNVEESAEYEAPLWIEVAPDCEMGARVTMDNVIRHGYLDLGQPEQSLLLLKPLAESQGGLSHGGGDKFENQDDPGYQSFLYFIQRLAACETSTSE
jgi:hypothetical protein